MRASLSVTAAHSLIHAPLARVLEFLPLRRLQLDLVNASRQSLVPEVLERGHEGPQQAKHFFPGAQSSPRLREASKSFRLCLPRSPSLLSQLAAGRSRAQDARNDTSQNAQTDIDSLFCKLADAKKLLDPEEI